MAWAPPPPTPATNSRVSRRTTLAVVAGVIALVAAIGIGGYLLRGPSSASQSATPQPSTTPSASVEQVVAKVVPSVVDLRIDMGSQVQEGSGIVMSADGLILTNHHIIAALVDAPASGKVTVTFSDGRTAPCNLVGTDPTSDIAVVRVQGVSGLRPIEMGSSSKLQVGQPVVAIGSPLASANKTTSGTISALNRPVTRIRGNQNTELDAIQTTAVINPSYSGGALVDMQGQLVAVNFADADATLDPEAGDPQGGGFAIPIDQAKRIADELIATGKATHATLGLQLMTHKAPPGAQVMELINGGAAAIAGVPKGAVVTKFDDRPINSADALVAAIRAKAPGDKVSLTYQDPSGGSRTVLVTLGRAES
jgi:putative serine protease PepD